MRKDSRNEFSFFHFQNRIELRSTVHIKLLITERILLCGCNCYLILFTWKTAEELN